MSITEDDHPDWTSTQIPKYFDNFDVRKDPKQHVEDKLYEVIHETFEARRKVEKNMTRRDLMAYDRVLAQYLEKEHIMEMMMKNLEDEHGQVLLGGQLIMHDKASTVDEDYQDAKMPSATREVRANIKNEDSLYKQVAFEAMNEMRNKAIMEDPNEHFSVKNRLRVQKNEFSKHYSEYLYDDAFRPQREINPKDYEPREHVRGVPLPKLRTDDDFQKDFEADHRLYIENR